MTQPTFHGNGAPAAFDGDEIDIQNAVANSQRTTGDVRSCRRGRPLGPLDAHGSAPRWYGVMSAPSPDSVHSAGSQPPHPSGPPWARTLGGAVEVLRANR